MKRFTRLCKDTEDGRYGKFVVGNYNGIYSGLELSEAVDKLGHYEDLEEQGRLIILASDIDQLRIFKNKCKICPHWNGESCKKVQCPIYIKIKELSK